MLPVFGRDRRLSSAHTQNVTYRLTLTGIGADAPDVLSLYAHVARANTGIYVKRSVRVGLRLWYPCLAIGRGSSLDNITITIYGLMG
jgi:hypothetical protein